MNAIPTLRLAELRERLQVSGMSPGRLFVRDVKGHQPIDVKDDIIAALSRLFEAEAELAAIKAEVELKPDPKDYLFRWTDHDLQPSAQEDKARREYMIDLCNYYRHRAEHLAARNVELVGLIREVIQADWRSNDNSLWHRLCKASK